MLLACIGCKEQGLNRPPAPLTTVDDLMSSVESALARNEYAQVSHLLDSVDAERLAAAECNSSSHVRYVAIAEEAILIPGLPVDVENEILREKDYVEIPGLGDDSPIPDPYREDVFQSARRFASEYNSSLAQLLER